MIKNFFWLSSIIILGVSLLSCSKTKKDVTEVLGSGMSASTGAITGKVTTQSFQAISGASLWTEPSSSLASSGNDGKYTLWSITPGSYTVKAWKTGYDTKSETVTVIAAEKVTVNIKLSPAKGGGGGGGGGGTQSGGTMTIHYTRSANDYSATNAQRTAVWIENMQGILIKTLYRSVGGSFDNTTRLVNWESKSGKQSNNTTDTYTSATTNGGSKNQSYQFSWDMKDSSGNIVPDGDYRISIEVSRYSNFDTAYYGMMIVRKGTQPFDQTITPPSFPPMDMLSSIRGIYTPPSQ